MNLQLAPYHSLTDIGLTAWNSEAQAYFLVPFAEVSAFFKTLSAVIDVPVDLVDTAYNFLADYDPNSEVVLLTLNCDLLTVAVINKYEPATREAKAERVGWPLPKYTAFEYLVIHDAPISLIQDAFQLTGAEYDDAAAIVLGD